MEILGGLALFGSILNSNEDDKNTKKRSNKVKKSRRNEDDIYNSNNSDRVRRVSQNLSSEKFRQSKNTDKYKVVPKYYNRSKKTQIKNKSNNTERFSDSDSDYSDNESCYTMDTMKDNKSIDFSDPTFFIKQQDNIIDNRKYERKAVKKTKDRNNFLSQFDDLQMDNPSVPSSYNAVNENNGSNSTVKRMEMERKLASDDKYSNFAEGGDDTYGVVSKEQLTHNNMVPYFSGKGGYGRDSLSREHRSNQHQRKMESFTGSLNDPSYRPKTERKPLFSPLVGMTNIYGNSVKTDDFEGRYIPSKERRGELPFQQVRETPGLNLGKNESAQFGLHDLHRVYGRTTDEIRGPRCPKVSYKGVIIPGMKGERGPIIGKQVQRKADTFKEWGTDRMVKGLGYIRAPVLHGEFNPKYMASLNRGIKDQQHYGAPQSSNYTTPNQLRGNFRGSVKQNFKQAEPRNVVMVEGLGARPDSNSYVLDPTQRSQSNSYIGPAGTSKQQQGHAFDVVTGIPDATNRDIYKVMNRVGAAHGTDTKAGYVINYIDNMPQITKRNLHEKADRAGASMSGPHSGHYTYDPTDVPNINMRNVHDKCDRAGTGVNGAHAGHHTYDPNDVPNVNMRNVHSKTDRAGTGVNGAHAGHHTYDPNDVPDTNMRNVHSKTDRAGTGVHGSHAGHHTYDPNDVPDTNMRNVHSKTDRAGTGVHGSHAGHHTYDPNDVPNVNMRNVHSKTDRAGTGVHGSHAGHHTYDPNDVPDTNMRNVHSKTDRAGTGVHGSHAGHHTYDPNDVPDINMRNVHSKTDRTGVAIKGNSSGHHTYDPNDVPDINMRNVHSKTDRAGAGIHGSHSGHHAYDPNDVPDINMRNVHSKTDRTGAAIKGNSSGHYTYDPTDIPDPTRRDIHKSSRTGGAGYSVDKPMAFDYVNGVPEPTRRDIHKSSRTGGAGHSVDKPMAFDYVNGIPEPTRRNQHNSSRSKGGVGFNVDKPVAFDYVNSIPEPTRRNQHNSSRSKGGAANRNSKPIAFDYVNNIPDPTRRDQHNSSRSKGGAGHEQEKPFVFDYINNIPDVTLREIQGETKAIGHAHAHEQTAQRSRRDAHNMSVNTSKEKIAAGRAPTNSNYDKGPTFEFTQVELKDPIQINRELIPDTIPCNGKIIPRQSYNGNSKFYVNDRILSHIEDNLDGNPFVNNLLHKST